MMPLRLLLVHPGANFSTVDVAHGYAEALTRAGHDIGVYALNARLAATARYMRALLTAARRNDPSLPKKPQFGDVTLKASEDIVLAALRGRVDAVIVISALFINPAALRLLRAARVPVGVVFTESPYQDEEQGTYADLASCCWTNDRTSSHYLRRFNARSWYLPAAYRAGFHVPGEPDPSIPAHDVMFVGTYFPERLALLAAVDWTGIDLGLYGHVEPEQKRTRAYRKLAPYFKGPAMDNADALAYYRRARLTLNLNRTCEHLDGDTHVTTGESLNPRAYELAAVGACQVAEYRAEYADVFGASVPTFTTAAELGSVVRALLPSADVRAALAAEAQRRVAPHSFDARAAQLIDQLGAAVLSNPLAPARHLAAAD